jgi:high-affinity nickel-transport protein
MVSLLSPARKAAGPDLRRRVSGLFALLIGANALVWLWAFAALQAHALLLGSAVLAYTIGLRHALDADHIAAIDNSTRKLMQQGQRPVAVGLYFSLGHSLVVVLLSVAVGVAATQVSARFADLRAFGSVLGTGASALFLLLLAAFNLVVLFSVYRLFRAVRSGRPLVENDFDVLLDGSGFLARLFRPLFRVVSRSWHLFPIGFLFGLGFDTATEVALFGMSATQTADGVSFTTLLVFPALFAAGMSLVDTADGVLMLGAYGWAFMRPIRKLYYNLTITAISVLVAVLIAGIETLGLIGDQFKLEGRFWDLVGALNGHFGAVGYLVVLCFAVAWIISVFVYRIKGYDDLHVATRG